MFRQARKESGTGIYHVMLRGINRQDIFEETEDYMQYFVTLLRYIHQNPTKAGIVCRVGDYDCSSWKEYTGEVPAALRVCLNENDNENTA